jgi:hypothetical protein
MPATLGPPTSIASLVRPARDPRFAAEPEHADGSYLVPQPPIMPPP